MNIWVCNASNIFKSLLLYFIKNISFINKHQNTRTDCQIIIIKITTCVFFRTLIPVNTIAQLIFLFHMRVECAEFCLAEYFTTGTLNIDNSMWN